MRQPLATRCRDHPTHRDVTDDYPIQYGVRSLRRRLLQIASGGLSADVVEGEIIVCPDCAVL